MAHNLVRQTRRFKEMKNTGGDTFESYKKELYNEALMLANNSNNKNPEYKAQFCINVANVLYKLFENDYVPKPETHISKCIQYYGYFLDAAQIFLEIMKL